MGGPHMRQTTAGAVRPGEGKATSSGAARQVARHFWPPRGPPRSNFLRGAPVERKIMPNSPGICGMSVRWNMRGVRLAGIGMILILLIVGYIGLLRYLHVSEMPAERDLGLKNVVDPVPQIYIEPISIDALNDAMQMRVSFAPSGTLYGERLAPTERRFRMVITHDRAVEEIEVEANARPPTASRLI